MLLSQRVQNQTMLLKTLTCQTFICVLRKYPKRKDEQRESCLLPFVACRTVGGWQPVRTPLNACWLLMFGEGQTLPASCNIACYRDVIRPQLTHWAKTYSQMCIGTVGLERKQNVPKLQVGNARLSPEYETLCKMK